MEIESICWLSFITGNCCGIKKNEEINMEVRINP